MTAARNRFSISGDCAHLDPTLIGARAEAIADRLIAALDLEVSDWMPVRVYVGDGHNATVGRQLHVSPPRVERRLSSDDWFELLFGHELTHLLIADYWGMAPVLFWEGVPIHLADNYVRTRALGSTYHEYCRAYLESHGLLRLDELLLAENYYGRRADPRVDIQAGSFCGFLLETHGTAAVRELFRAYAVPSVESPQMVINPLLERHFGRDLRALSDTWVRFLADSVSREARLVSRLRRLEAPGRTLGRRRCNFCLALVPVPLVRCPSCGADAVLDVKIV